MITNATATLYNHYTDPTTERTVYKRTFLGKVSWNVLQKTGFENKTLISDDMASIYIPFNSITDKTYIDPKAFRKLSDEDKEHYFTLDNDDYIVKGEIDSSLSFDSVKKTNETYNIISVRISDFGSKRMHHYEVSAK